MPSAWASSRVAAPCRLPMTAACLPVPPHASRGMTPCCRSDHDVHRPACTQRQLYTLCSGEALDTAARSLAGGPVPPLDWAAIERPRVQSKKSQALKGCPGRAAPVTGVQLWSIYGYFFWSVRLDYKVPVEPPTQLQIRRQNNQSRPPVTFCTILLNGTQVSTYLGPSPPWGVAQLISWLGTLMSHVLQWTQLAVR